MGQLLPADDDEAPRSRSGPTIHFECSVCGYGARRSTPPERCPMCQGEATWIRAPWRGFSRSADALGALSAPQT